MWEVFEKISFHTLCISRSSNTFLPGVLLHFLEISTFHILHRLQILKSNFLIKPSWWIKGHIMYSVGEDSGWCSCSYVPLLPRSLEPYFKEITPFYCNEHHKNGSKGREEWDCSWKDIGSPYFPRKLTPPAPLADDTVQELIRTEALPERPQTSGRPVISLAFLLPCVKTFVPGWDFLSKKAGRLLDKNKFCFAFPFAPSPLPLVSPSPSMVWPEWYPEELKMLLESELGRSPFLDPF